MAPTIAPDPDLRAADSDAGKRLREQSAKLSAHIAVIEREAEVVRVTVEGETPAAKLEALAETRQSLERQVVLAEASAALHDELHTAAMDFRRDAPSKLEVGIAWAAMEDASTALQAVAEADTAIRHAARERLRAAETTYGLLEKRRAAAIAAYGRAEEVAVSRFQERCQTLGREAPKVSGDGRKRGSNPKQDRTPATTAPAPRTGTPSPPTTSLSSTPAPTAAQSAAQAALATPPVGQPVQLPPQQPAQQQAPPPTVAAPAPVAAPVAAAPAPTAQSRNDKSAVDSRALDDMLGIAPVAAMAAMPTAAPVTAPSPATAPASTPSGPTGTSHSGLTTDANTSGRADGSARTGLSAASTEQATGPASQRPGEAGARQMGGTPMGPMMGMGAGAPTGPKKDGEGEQVLRHHSADGAVLHGDETVSEAVRGGTLAQRRDGTSAA